MIFVLLAHSPINLLHCYYAGAGGKRSPGSRHLFFKVNSHIYSEWAGLKIMQDGKLHKITVNMKSGSDSSSWVGNCSSFLHSIVNCVTSESKCGQSHKAASEGSLKPHCLNVGFYNMLPSGGFGNFEPHLLPALRLVISL